MKIKALTIPALIALFILCFFYKPLFLSSYFYHADLGFQFVNFSNYGSDVIKSGIMPNWSPEMEFGYPFSATSQSNPCLYPLNLLVFFLPAHINSNYTIILHFILLMLLTYLFARSISLSKTASLVVSVLFSYSGSILTRITQSTLLDSALWLPLILLMIKGAFRDSNKAYFILAGMMFGVQFLGGTQLWFYTMIVITFYVGLEYYLKYVKETVSKSLITNNFVIPLCTVIILGVLISAVQFLPQYELSQNAGRAEGEMTYKLAGSMQLCPEEVISLVYPKLFGFRPNLEYLGRSFPFAEHGYFGIFSLFLFMIALMNIKKNAYVVLFLFLALVSFIAALGKYSPIFFIQYHIPGFSHLRYPMEYLFIFSFSMSVLCGIGIDHLTGNKITEPEKSKLFKRSIYFSGVVILMTFFCSVTVGLFKDKIIYLVQNILESHNMSNTRYMPKVTEFLSRLTDPNNFIIPVFFMLSFIVLFRLWHKMKISKTGFKLLILAGIFTDLFIVFHNFNPLIDKSYFTKIPYTAKYLAQNAGLFRVYPVNGDFYKKIAYSQWDFKNAAGQMLSRESLHSALQYHIPSIIRATSVPVKRYLQYYNYAAGIDSNNVEEKMKILGLANVKYILSSGNYDTKSLELVYRGDIDIYRNKQVFPRVFGVTSLIRAGSENEALDLIKTGKIDFNNSAVIEAKNVTAEYLKPPGMRHTKNIILREYSNNRVTLDVEFRNSGVLILNDLFYTGWKAYVNGKVQEIFPVNLIMKGILLKEGKYRVNFVYDPFSYKVGLLLTLLSVALLGIYFVNKMILGDKAVLTSMHKKCIMIHINRMG
ncbi:MAG: YfhO family protein [Elusimicrobia bacterium]|nr:YfhO family protein [Candidatus Liberimonas magnetica]